MSLKRRPRVGGLVPAIKENSLSIVLFALFVICISAQSLAGWRSQNEMLAAYGRAPVDYGHYVTSGTFLEGLASNWQAAVLQLGSLILFSGFLYQRGSPHSRDPRKAKPKDRKRQAGGFIWFYRNSLFLAFLLLFVLALALHVGVGAAAYNEDRSLVGQSPISVTAFLLSAKFWSTTLQTWQAEYLVIVIYLVFSVFLRQQDSAESKPVESSNETTGEANK
jgi:hypothetical protein